MSRGLESVQKKMGNDKGKKPQYPLKKGWVGLNSRSGCYGEQNYYVSLPRIKLQPLCHQARSLITIPTKKEAIITQFEVLSKEFAYRDSEKT